MNNEEIIEHINNEIFKNENNKKKKRNIIFSIIKRIIMNAWIYLDYQLIQLKELLVMPYPKEKQKKNIKWNRDS